MVNSRHPDDPDGREDIRPPAAGVGKRGRDGHIAYLLRQAQHATRHRIEAALAGFDVTYPQFTVMTMVRSYENLSAADIARLCMLTPQTVTVIVRNLIRDGLIDRRKDPVHGRIFRLALTDEGGALLKRCRRRLDKIEAEMTKGLPPATEAAIRDWLTGLASAD